MVMRHVLAVVAALLAASAFAACGTDAVATDGCRKIEQARCRRAPTCPALQVSAGLGVEECVQFARDRCLHGLAVADPGAGAIDACVAAIEATSSCDAIAAPETLPACAFLQPVPASDAGSDGPDAALDATEGPAEGG
jgi:hypothetical protein